MASGRPTDLLFRGNRRLLAEVERSGVPLAGGAAVEGLLEEREGLCLFGLARRAAALGNAVEIGSYKGRSTWYLAQALESAASPFRVVAIDPHLEGTTEAFAETLRSTGIADRVDTRAAFSQDVAVGFDEPVGLLWIDGDHSYAGVRRDFEEWFPKLALGGYVAFHDTINRWYGPTRLVRELLARRSDLEQVGVIGVITYARKTRPSVRARLAALRGRIGFELVTALWGLRVGFGPVESAPGER
jgi:predicted O-methyltransferase YrrM